jgi:hypothetical protein
MNALIERRVLSVAGLACAVLLAAGLTACRVRVDKDEHGEKKNVQVDTPFGGVHVNTDQTTASDLGLPIYPGASPIQGDDKHKSADVHMGFGEWQLRVRAVSYDTADSQAQVIAFYKKALDKYGDVLTCHDHQPVGSPTITSQGLSCEDEGKAKVEIDGHKNGFVDRSEIELKAGSKRHQHIVGFENAKNGRTRFALVALDLPTDLAGKGKSD